MKRLLLIAILLTPSMATAQTTADAAYGVRYNAEELVVNLPDDQAKPYLTIFGQPNDSRFEMVRQWFADGQLKRLRDRSHYTEMETTGAMFRDRYATTTAVTPCVRIQAPDGTILFQACGNRIPLSPEALTRAINASNCFRDRQHSDPDPQPLDNAGPPPPPPPPPPAAPSKHFPWLLLVGLTITGAALGIAKQWHDTYHKTSNK